MPELARKVRYFSPKLLPFLGLSGFLYLTRSQFDLVDITSRLPANIYDVRRIDGLRFGTRLFRDLTLRDEMDGKAFLAVRPQEGDTVFDVGANIGAYALRYATIVGPSGQVVAFEPVPHNRRILAWNIKLNSLWNVSVRPEALGDFDGKATLNLSRGPSAESFIREARKSGEISVQVTTLDSIRLENLDLIKIDVEGAELSVLRGAKTTLRNLRPRMQIEVHAPHDEECVVCTWLSDLGYSTRLIHLKTIGAKYKKKFGISQIHWVDAVAL